MELFEKATKLIKGFKGEKYAFGLGVIDKVGEFASRHGKRALVIGNEKHLQPVFDKVVVSLNTHGMKLAGGRVLPGAGPNSPREDVYRIDSYILHYQPDCIVPIGGGSTIDAAKAANLLATLGEYSPEIDTYFGTGLVSAALTETGKSLKPLIPVQTVAGSAAHLTKYSNVTDPVAGQKKLIVDEALVPVEAVFDYGVTASVPVGVTIDGVLDTFAHCLEVFLGADGAKFDLLKEVAECGISLVLQNAAKAINNPSDLEARQALGLAADLGGYSIMIGGTNGAHLTSFSLVDLTSHGRACGIMNPYYTVFFAPSVERQLRLVSQIFKEAGFITTDLDNLRGRELGIKVAEGMTAFNESIGAPTKLSDLPGFNEEHINRALTAAKDPQLEMKLKNMPVPLTASLVDEFMGPILNAAKTGDFSLIKNMP